MNPTMNLEQEILALVAAKKGDKEIAVFYDGRNWSISLGNPSGYVMLGEVPGELESDGATLSEAIDNMKVLLKNQS